jgi:hypothetical protein
MEPVKPVELIDSNIQVPDNLRRIITLLENYLRDFMNENTINSQNSQTSLDDAKKELRIKAGILLHYIKTRQDIGNDPILSTLMKGLEKELEPWDPRVSTLTQDYIKTLFIECPPTVSLIHCRRLRKEAQEYASPVDGE